MLAVALTLAIAFPPAQAPEVKAFQDAFALRKAEFPSEKPDAAIQKAMDILIDKLRKDTTGNSTIDDVAKILNPFTRAVQREEVFSTSYASIGGAVSRGFGRVAVGVRMGAASRMRVFSAASGKPVPTPKEFDWQYQYDSNPILMSGGKVVVDSPGIQDAGVRYGYRVWVLNTAADGIKVAKRLDGVWTLEDETNGHMSLEGTTLTLSTIDDPKTFLTTSPERLFTRITTYDLSTPIPTRLKSDAKDPIFRQLDDWMYHAIKSPSTDLEKRFQKAFGPTPKAADFNKWDMKRTGDTVRLELDLGNKYVFTMKDSPDGYKVVDFTYTKE